MFSCLIEVQMLKFYFHTWVFSHTGWISSHHQQTGVMTVKWSSAPSPYVKWSVFNQPVLCLWNGPLSQIHLQQANIVCWHGLLSQINLLQVCIFLVKLSDVPKSSWASLCCVCEVVFYPRLFPEACIMCMAWCFVPNPSSAGLYDVLLNGILTQIPL